MSRISDWCSKNDICLQAFADWQVSLDPYEEYWYAGDKNTAKIELILEDTVALCEIADVIRQEDGYKPIYGTDDHGEYDKSGWYNFYVTVSDANKHIDSIRFTVVNYPSADNELMYEIFVTEEESTLIYAEINNRCKKLWGVDCKQLLEEDREYNKGVWQ